MQASKQSTSTSEVIKIKDAFKNINNIDTSGVEVPQLPQSKFHLKIIGIPYFPHNNSQKHLFSGDVENIIKQNQIFNNVVLTSKL